MERVLTLRTIAVMLDHLMCSFTHQHLFKKRISIALVGKEFWFFLLKTYIFIYQRIGESPSICNRKSRGGPTVVGAARYNGTVK